MPTIRWILFGFFLIATCIAFSSAATLDLHIIKYTIDGQTIEKEMTVPYLWLEQNLPVHGDGVTHYYHQGPVFADDPDPAREAMIRWNPEENTNVQEKDMGAVKGTDLRDICDLVGGMSPGDTVKVKASDGFVKEFAYRNVYSPTARQGPLVVTWWKADSGYVPDYREGMRLVFYADTSSNPWGLHAFGNWDWHESSDEQFWYFYRQGDQKYPTTTGLSVQYVSDILIYPGSETRTASPDPTLQHTASPTQTRFSLFVILCALAGCGFLAYSMKKRE